jgi:hypothetical protein
LTATGPRSCSGCWIWAMRPGGIWYMPASMAFPSCGLGSCW